MNSAIKSLFLKDIALIKKKIIWYLFLGLASIAAMAVPLKGFGFLGSILLVTAIVAFYCHLIFKTIIIERKGKNHLFLMTLPVKPSQIALVKLLSSVFAFLFV